MIEPLPSVLTLRGGRSNRERSSRKRDGEHTMTIKLVSACPPKGRMSKSKKFMYQWYRLRMRGPPAESSEAPNSPVNKLGGRQRERKKVRDMDVKGTGSTHHLGSTQGEQLTRRGGRYPH